MNLNFSTFIINDYLQNIKYWLRKWIKLKERFIQNTNLRIYPVFTEKNFNSAFF